MDNLSLVDDNIIEDSLRSFANVSNSINEFALNLMMELGIPQELFLIIDNLVINTVFMELALKILGNLLCGKDNIVDQLLGYDIIKVLAKHLNHNSPAVRRKIMWCFSNLAAGNSNQIKYFVDTGIFKEIFECVKDPNMNVVKETIITINNILKDCEIEICQIFVEMGCLDVINHLINTNMIPEILIHALLTLRDIFNFGMTFKQNNDQKNPYVEYFIEIGGTNGLEKLQMHENNEVYNLALDILEGYFSVQKYI